MVAHRQTQNTVTVLLIYCLRVQYQAITLKTDQIFVILARTFLWSQKSDVYKTPCFYTQSTSPYVLHATGTLTVSVKDCTSSCNCTSKSTKSSLLAPRPCQGPDRGFLKEMWWKWVCQRVRTNRERAMEGRVSVFSCALLSP